ncbi:relaxase/mobilization nuclease [Streptomyces sp. NPDC056399]|uniref:relaxase/mobilization nuclease n=1 Tax=Streptomyces sp. NPDC056399 TaxID=3345807 RepID=UPI0035D7490F
MIIRVHQRGGDVGPVLADDVFDTPLSYKEKLPADIVVAYWPGLDVDTAVGEPGSWTVLDWAEHINDPLFEYPFAVSPGQDRRSVFHLDVRLAPEDRSLTGQEWSEVAHRLARAASIEIPGDDQGCRWVAFQARPHHLSLIASLIWLDGTWQRQPAGFRRHLAAEARRLESDLGLLTPGALTPTDRIAPLAEVTAPLADARRVIELHAQLLAGHPQAPLREAGHRLEWLARRLFDLERDLTTTAAELRRPPAPPGAMAPSPPAAVPAARTGARPPM